MTSIIILSACTAVCVYCALQTTKIKNDIVSKFKGVSDRLSWVSDMFETNPNLKKVVAEWGDKLLETEMKAIDNNNQNAKDAAPNPNITVCNVKDLKFFKS